jgi:hypothetical protein
MSQTFENIKNDVLNFRNDTEKNKTQAQQLAQQSTAQDRKVLIDSGVKSVFEEIRDSGLVVLRPNNGKKTGFMRKLFRLKNKERAFVPAQVIDSYYYISLRFDEYKNTASEIRIAAIDGRLNIAHGYNRVDFTVISDGGLADAIVEGLKNPLRIRDGF